jgi:hypothetical protein
LFTRPSVQAFKLQKGPPFPVVPAYRESIGALIGDAMENLSRLSRDELHDHDALR